MEKLTDGEMGRLMKPGETAQAFLFVLYVGEGGKYLR
jgi:hypothetical protein